MRCRLPLRAEGVVRTMLPAMERTDPSSPPPYGIALLGIIAVILLSAGSGSSSPVGALALVVQGAVLVFVLRISDVRGRVGRIATIVTVALVILGVASIIVEGVSATVSTLIVGLLFAVATPVAIVRRIIREGKIDAPVVAGALCIYLLIGLFYVQVYTLFDRATDGQFFVQVQDPTPTDFTYFSYVTMTTVGYGDLTASGNLERMIAVTEALIGQLYLVTVIGLAVSRVRPGARRGHLAEDLDEELEAQARDDPGTDQAGP